MSSVTAGTKLPDGTIVIKGDAQHLDKLYCMLCHGSAFQITKPNGSRVYRCANCGAEWVARKF